MNNSAGSYDYGKFQGNQAEMDRLNVQAKISIELEKSKWESLGLKPGMNVVDFACGTGLVTIELAKYVKPGKVVGVDISPALLEEARKYAATEGVDNVEFVAKDIYNLDLDGKTFDFAYARFLFQHLEDPVKALTNIKSVLKPNGLMCAIDVDDQWLSFYPKDAEFQEFIRLAAEGQASRGGDRFVGRKLGHYYTESGLSNPNTIIQVVTTKELSVTKFLDITTGFKLEQLTKDNFEKGKALLDDLYNTVDNPTTWGAVGVFITVGINA